MRAAAICSRVVFPAPLGPRTTQRSTLLDAPRHPVKNASATSDHRDIGEVENGHAPNLRADTLSRAAEGARPTVVRVSVELIQRAAATRGVVHRGASRDRWGRTGSRSSSAVTTASALRGPDESEPLTLPFAVARWRRLGVTGWTYLPVAPGDAAALRARRRSPQLPSTVGWPWSPWAGRRWAWSRRLRRSRVSGRSTQTAGPGRILAESPAEAERSLLEALNGGVAALEAHRPGQLAR